MTPIISPNKAVLFAVTGFILYWVLALVVPSLILRDVFNALAFGAATVITVTWAPAAIKAVREEADDGSWQLVLAIFILWAVALAQRLYTIVFNSYDRPDAWAVSPIAGFWPYSYFLAGVLFLAAPAVRPDGFRIHGVWTIAIAGAIGGLLAGLLIGLSIPSV